MARLGVSLHVQGVGLVVAQYPAAGDTVAVGGACTIVLERAPVRDVRAGVGASP
jgi:beta-lactam-binding protein with PASTA domain